MEGGAFDHKAVEKEVRRLARLVPPDPVADRLEASCRDASLDLLVEHLFLAPALAASVLRAGAELGGPMDPERPLTTLARWMGRERLAELLLHEIRDARSMWAARVSEPAGGDDRAMTPPMVLVRPDKGLWGHCVATAIGTELIAAQLGGVPLEQARVAGLLHDLGKAAVQVVEPAITKKINKVAVRDRVPYLEAERRVGLAGHAYLGAELARRWRIPDPVLKAVRHHHHPRFEQRGNISRRVSRLVDMVIVADAMARRKGLGGALDSMGSPAWGAEVRERLGLSREALVDLTLRLETRYDDAVRQVIS